MIKDGFLLSRDSALVAMEKLILEFIRKRTTLANTPPLNFLKVGGGTLDCVSI